MLLRTRIYFTGIITLAVWLFLAWEHFNGGVRTHHFLADKNLPGFSNWLGGILIPVLTWFLLYRIQMRIDNQQNGGLKTSNHLKPVIYKFIAALLFGVLLSVFFKFGYSDIPGYMFLGLLLISLFFPLYWAECLLGFVIGMMQTFGTVIPTLIGSILIAVTAINYLFIRRGFLFIYLKLFSTKKPRR
jgi:fatty-acid desaturase